MEEPIEHLVASIAKRNILVNQDLLHLERKHGETQGIHLNGAQGRDPLQREEPLIRWIDNNELEVEGDEFKDTEEAEGGARTEGDKQVVPRQVEQLDAPPRKRLGVLPPNCAPVAAYNGGLQRIERLRSPPRFSPSSKARSGTGFAIRHGPPSFADDPARAILKPG